MKLSILITRPLKEAGASVPTHTHVQIKSPTWPAGRPGPQPVAMAGSGPAGRSRGEGGVVLHAALGQNRARDKEWRPQHLESQKALSFVRLPPTEGRQKGEG